MEKNMRDKLRGLIIGSGKSMEAVAREMGITRQTLSTRINGRKDFTLGEMKRFAASVGKDAKEIFF